MSPINAICSAISNTWVPDSHGITPSFILSARELAGGGGGYNTKTGISALLFDEHNAKQKIISPINIQIRNKTMST